MQTMTAGPLALVEPAPLLARITSPDELAAAFLAGYGQGTRDAYARDLRGWGDYLDGLGVGIFDARRVHVDAYCRAAEEQGTSPAIVARRLATLSGFYAYATDEALIARSPVQRVRRPRVSDES